MKKAIAILTLSLSSTTIFAQWTTSGNDIYNANNGNVGVGVSNPSAKLEVADAGGASFRVGINSNKANTNAQIHNSLAVVGNDNSSITSNAAVAWDFYNNGVSPSYAGTLLQHIGTGVTGNLYGAPAANLGALNFQNVSNGLITSNGANIFISPAGTISTSFLNNGSVGIGTTDTKGYKLAVNGNAIFTGVVVKLYGNWPDYVFKKDYQLPSLDQVAQFIKTNNHLPGIASSQEISDNGIDLGKMNASLLEKIEELTLYMIELKNENKEIKKELSRLQGK